MSEIADFPLCRWVEGLFFALFIGTFVVALLVMALRRLGEVPNPIGFNIKARLFGFITGIFERGFFLGVAVAEPLAALAFGPAWMGLKLAANWNRAGRVEAFDWPEGTTEEVKTERLARGAFSALFGSLFSISFGIGGGLIVQGELAINLFC